MKLYTSFPTRKFSDLIGGRRSTLHLFSLEKFLTSREIPSPNFARLFAREILVDSKISVAKLWSSFGRLLLLALQNFSWKNRHKVSAFAPISTRKFLSSNQVNFSGQTSYYDSKISLAKTGQLLTRHLLLAPEYFSSKNRFVFGCVAPISEVA